MNVTSNGVLYYTASSGETRTIVYNIETGTFREMPILEAEAAGLVAKSSASTLGRSAKPEDFTEHLNRTVPPHKKSWRFGSFLFSVRKLSNWRSK